MSNLEYKNTDFEMRYLLAEDAFTIIAYRGGVTLIDPIFPWDSFERLTALAIKIYKQAKPMHDAMLELEKDEAIFEVENIAGILEKRSLEEAP